MTTRATFAELQELHALLVRFLIERVQGQSSAELLSVARALLVHNQVVAQTDKDAKQLRRLYVLLVTRLGEALREERPSASMLSEARAFLHQQGITKDFGAAVERASTLDALASSSLPFSH